MHEEPSSQRRRREKVCLFVDFPGLAIARLHEEGVKLDFKKLKDWAAQQREVLHAMYYCGEIHDEAQQRANFYEVLKRAGYEIRPCCNPHSQAKESHFDEKIRSACHCVMVWDMCSLTLTGRFDTFIIVTGSSDFEPIAPWIRQRGIEVELLFFENHTCPILKSKCDRFREIDMDAVVRGVGRQARPLTPTEHDQRAGVLARWIGYRKSTAV